MVSEKMTLNGFDIVCHSLNTLIIGSGAASLNAAVSLARLGQKDIAVVTERMNGGTSANAGSDKQTYYKLSLAGDVPDSPVMLAEDLFRGRCMHGDIALCEAQGSVDAFMNLIRIGVPFPRNRFGAWVGYKTDNDTRERATSAGPYTSSLMTKALSAEMKKEKIKIFGIFAAPLLLISARRISGRHLFFSIPLIQFLEQVDRQEYTKRVSILVHSREAQASRLQQEQRHRTLLNRSLELHRSGSGGTFPAAFSR